MSPEFHFTCVLEHGLHARPASVLAAASRGFAARVELIKQSAGRSVDARSVLSIVALDVSHGESCTIRAHGADADEAISAIREIIEQGFGESAAAVQEAAGAEESAARAALPAGLRRLNAKFVAGTAVSPGVATGPVRLVVDAGEHAHETPSRGVEVERESLQHAIEHVRTQVQSHVERVAVGIERDLLLAHAGIVEDPALLERIDAEITGGASAIAAVRVAAGHFKNSLRSASSQYIRDRAVDVEDVCGQVIEALGATEHSPVELAEPSVIIADILTPRQMMQMDRAKVLALVLGRVGVTSHTAILARAFGIPTVLDVPDVLSIARDRDREHVLVDADGGFVILDVTSEVNRYYALGRSAGERRCVRLAHWSGVEARTSDGVRIEVAANVSTAEEVERAVAGGSEGVGLFRTEMLFAERASPPDETEQFEEYSRAVQAAAGRPVIFRTFDIGGDKPAPYLRLPREANPFLGWRGIRLYESFPEMLRTQLRAILRASALGPVKVMAPMVTTGREAAWFRQNVRETQDELRREKHPFDEQMPVGVMIEVPSAAAVIDQLAESVDFFSIGTNDLAQYFMAADRGNLRVAHLCDPLTPAFVRLLKSIVDAANHAKRWIGVCGEMAGDPLHLPLMIGLGVHEISVAAAGGRVLELKAAMAALDQAMCRALVDRLIHCRDADAAREMLRMAGGGGGGGGAPAMIIDDLVVINSEAASKVEAIHELAALIAAAGRSDDLHALEEAVWAREETYSTGLGFGFAIPHCKSNAVRAPTVAVSKLAGAIDWEAADGEPVRIVMMLAIPDTPGEVVSRKAARVHMEVLAKLSRQLMHEEFREQVLQATSAEQVVAAVGGALDA